VVFLSAMLGAALVAGCGGTEGAPVCTDQWWLGRNNPASLTGAPLFSVSEIAPGDPLTISVPVNAETRSVSVGIRFVDQAGPQSGASAETDGDEIVELRVEDTNLPPGEYVADRINLWGDIAPQFAQHITPPLGMPYVLSIFPAAEAVLSCVTDIPSPTFTVVGP
jgi:hypothetical protein